LSVSGSILTVESIVKKYTFMKSILSAVVFCSTCLLQAQSINTLLIKRRY
jgi:hypothetical protein